jgi:DNA-directed RNA polymerase specialized sigma subunit
MKECARKCYIHKVPCSQSDCRLHLDYKEDFNCTDIAVHKHGEMTLEQIGNRHGVSIVRAKQIVDEALLKLKKTLSNQNTI